MVDRISKEKRSWNMSRIASGHTEPEKIVRSTLHCMGHRFSLHRRDLPGSPDIVMPKYNTVILVHGCFWHRHKGCKRTTTPKSNKVFWQKKFTNNITRDKKVKRDLKKLGWKVLTVWECETKKPEKLIRKLSKLRQPE